MSDGGRAVAGCNGPDPQEGSVGAGPVPLSLAVARVLGVFGDEAGAAPVGRAGCLRAVAGGSRGRGVVGGR